MLERLGTDGDMQRARQMLLALDGKVDAFGLGGTDLYIVAGDKRYTFREIAALVKGVIRTPILDGSGLKHTLEREAIEQLEPLIHWKGCRTLLVSSVDRFGMAEALIGSGRGRALRRHCLRAQYERAAEEHEQRPHRWRG